ncbi:class Ib ribonucleoside-diphosphate reductase assembly flavoprotein NrdI [Paenibacillus puerhi]|uniref:class Ib ribonucleoside-diphosphate reductase assembly flavoprotein NrdI n=1 Tax=Paenibacillus puerhi TaxID=2692622 RepID=UPI001359BEAA|nr:class Ib ribonucleoside-diphosphate reductase assembly flavoprotein NrdI [Paenibacillus puerhi]
MLVLYDSKTGNVRRFIRKLNVRALQIEDDMLASEPFVLVTYTTGFGQVPERVASFLRANGAYMQGVAASGNRNWGSGFALSADKIAAEYQVPILAKFELAGTQRDVQQFMRGVDEVAAY